MYSTSRGSLWRSHEFVFPRNDKSYIYKNISMSKCSNLIDITKVSNYSDDWCMFYDFNLAARFASDYKIPIDGCDEANFRHSLSLYEDAYGAQTKWCNLVCNINRLYEGQDFAEKASKFLQEYYETRDRIIREVEQSDAYKEFNNLKVLPFQTNYVVKPVCGSKGIYNMQNVGKRFISIDMRNANFQTLCKCGVIKQNTYRDFETQRSPHWISQDVSC